MTITDDIVNNIEILARASVILKISFVLIPVALLLHVIGFSTRNWLDGEGSQGLWTFCNKTSVYKCCSTIEFHVEHVNSKIPDFVYATRVFQCLGLIGAVAAIVLIFLCIFLPTTNANRLVRKLTMIDSFITAGVIILGSIIYGGRYKYESLTSNYYLSSSFGLCTTAGIIFVFPGILLVIDEWKRPPDVRPQPSAPPMTPPTQNSSQTTGPANTSGGAAPPTSGGAQGNTGNQSNECSVCLDKPIETVFIPCGHSSCCVGCSNEIKNNERICPICRVPIRDVQRVFRT